MFLTKLLDLFKPFRMGTNSPSGKSSDPILIKLNQVLKEREELKEEIRLLRMALNKHYDV